MTLKVLSLNLWNGGRLMDGVVQFLKGQDADIVFLQEVYNATDPKLESRLRSIEVLQEKLDYPSCEFVPTMLDKSYGKDEGVVFGSAVLAKFPVTPSELVFFNEPFHELYSSDSSTFPTMPRTLQHVIVRAPEMEINAFNVHGVWDLNGDNFSDRRRNMRDIILKAIAGKINVILAGDTNAQPTNEMWQPIEEKLHSVFGTDVKSTFNMKHKDNPGYATARVDMIFVSPGIEVLERQCHEVDISDHLPLTATLQISEQS